MVELFGLIKKTKSIKIACDDITYTRTDIPVGLIDYIQNNLEDFDVVCFNVETDRAFNNRYIKSFDIEVYMPDHIYDILMDKYQCSIARYNKDGIDLSLYKLRM